MSIRANVNRTGNVLILFLVGATIVFSLVALYYYNLYQKTISSSASNDNLSEGTVENFPVCKYSLSDDKSYLETYIVKPGDSLLSVTTKQLGDVSRIGEVIALNKNEYPGLSIQNTFLEVGWRLYLPPKNRKASGMVRIGQIRGPIVKLGNNELEIGYVGVGIKGATPPITIDSQTELPSGYVPKVGDCVVGIEGSDGNRAFLYSLKPL